MSAPPSYYGMVLEAHAICGALAWVVFFPVGGIVIRALNHSSVLWLHVACQITGYILFCVTFGTGVWFEYLYGKVSNIFSVLDPSLTFGLQVDSPHPIIGMILFGLTTIQPFLGTIHHKRYSKVQRRTFLACLHTQLGRVLITIGILNGGLGLLLADDSTTSERMAYGIIGGVMWLSYVVLSSYFEGKTVKAASRRESERSSINGDVESTAGEKDTE